MDKQAVLEKIKKCLALSKSANEHEAAQAMKQAQALMKKYEVDAVDVVLSEVSERGSGRKMAVKLAEWQWAVANMISEVFGCKCYQLANAMFFYGLGNRAEIASYESLLRILWSMDSAKSQNLKNYPSQRCLGD